MPVSGEIPALNAKSIITNMQCGQGTQWAAMKKARPRGECLVSVRRGPGAGLLAVALRQMPLK